MVYLNASDEALKCYNSFTNIHLKEFSEMCDEQRLFLITLLLKYKPKKILELGVSAGGSSSIILNTINHSSPKSELHSIDLSKTWYKDDSHNTGFLIDKHFPHLKKHWNLYTGDLALSFVDEIGDNIDFCFIDTAHINPGEILDFLMVLPYLNKNAVIVFHDIMLHFNNTPQNITTNLLMSAIQGEHFLLKISPNSHRPFHNIGAIQLNKDIQENLFSVFNLFTLPWSYPLSDNDYQRITNHFERFYNQEFINIFKKSRDYYQKTYFV